MSPFNSVGGKLALALVVVVAGVLAIVYVIVVPLYKTSLQNAELRTLADELASGIVTYPRDPSSPYVDQWASAMAEQHAVRAIAFEYTEIPPTVAPFAEIRDGFPYSAIDDDWVFSGHRNGERFPWFGSADLYVNTIVGLPRHLPNARVGLKLYNLASVHTHHDPPRAVARPDH